MQLFPWKPLFRSNKLMNSCCTLILLSSRFRFWFVIFMSFKFNKSNAWKPHCKERILQHKPFTHSIIKKSTNWRISTIEHGLPGIFWILWLWCKHITRKVEIWMEQLFKESAFLQENYRSTERDHTMLRTHETLNETPRCQWQATQQRVSMPSFLSLHLKQELEV